MHSILTQYNQLLEYLLSHWLNQIVREGIKVRLLGAHGGIDICWKVVLHLLSLVTDGAFFPFNSST